MSKLIPVTAEEYLADAINSIAKKYPELRQQSKPVTFAATYGGTEYTLMVNSGFTRKEANRIMANYRKLYNVSIQWVEDKIKKSAKTGYIVTAFGLRVRAPLQKVTVRQGAHTPYAAKAEALTLGNALGQAWCLLNCRAANEFMARARASEYAHDIRIIAQIHDSIYLIIRNDMDVLMWVNHHLIDCMSWQDDPLLAHPTVKLGAELDVHYQSWAYPMTLPNNASKKQIKKLLKRGVEEILQAA